MPQKNMSPEVFEQALSSLEGLRHVELQGEGEPMLHPEFFRLAEIIRQRHPHARISLITNGSLLTAENVVQLIDLAFHKVSISIESPDPGEFSAVRGGKLEKVLDGIRLLMASRRQRQAARPAVGLAITILHRTVDKFASLLDLHDELGLDGGVTYQLLQTMPVYAQHYGPEMHAEILTADDRRKFVEELRHNPRTRDFFRQRGRPIGFYDELFANWHPRSGECPWLSRGLYVAFDGTTTGCCFIKDTARDGFGRVTPETLPVVLAKRDAMQNELRVGRIPLPCANCPTAKAIVVEAAKRRPIKNG